MAELEGPAWAAPPEVEQLAMLVHADTPQWWHSCHGASLQVVRSRVFAGARVARGSCIGVPGQHSWVVVGDPYDPTMIIDPTIWSYDLSLPVATIPRAEWGRYTPHGAGNIWDATMPRTAYSTKEKPIALAVPVSSQATSFLKMCGRLGKSGWWDLLHSPVGGWPAAEIFAAAADTPELAALVPIDILGMLTDRNPGGLYLPEIGPAPIL